ncbi:protein S-acyltransferase 18 [Olea europaea var. sylvestris]|uniref:S-acyltransferase n=1 Tax=Olea europaea subsp. europaea TaxID=158383 RepID=A0A8S0U891_OLEEU|nr:protein S-acyltransferase 18 [Olea europaea var. sylvestris]CAA3015126.1 S-acyltransferase 18 [Olea europaea subsp. europaea]
MHLSITARRHGWQRPLHPLQIVGISVFCSLVASFYCFLGIFLSNRIAEITLITVFSFAAVSVAMLFIRCAAIDPTDKTRFRFRKKKRKGDYIGFPKLNNWHILGRIFVRLFKRMERRILRTCIRRKYLGLWKSTIQMEPLIPFPLIVKDDAIAPDPKDEDISFCSICDFEVKKHSKHCRTCNRCVEGFDHHCRWLNNCVGRKNYTAFILLLISVLIMLIVEGGTAIAIFVRCFADKIGIQQELNRRHYEKFPRGVLAAISVLLVFVTAYSMAALGQLFFFHLILIKKGISTYEYILAMKEENESMELESLEDSDLSSEDEIFDNDSPKNSPFISQFICKEGRMDQFQKTQKLSIRIDEQPESSTLKKKKGFHASIDPWKLINVSREKALLAAEKAKERLGKQKEMLVESDPMKPLPLELKSGPLMKLDKNKSMAPLISKGGFVGSPGQFSSPRRRLSCSPSQKHKYKSDFDLKLTRISTELETYISRQVVCSVVRNDGSATSPR